MLQLLARYRQFLPILLLALVVIGGTFYFIRPPQTPALTIITPSAKPTPTLATIKVDVRGAINAPGVYALPLGSRVEDALTAAGNSLANADLSKLNLARKLADGELINVPAKGDASIANASPNAPTAATKSPSGKININIATIAELDTLPGIGPAIAGNIVDYRTQNGLFKKIEDLKKVKGIGDVIFEQIKDRITVE